MTLTTSTYDPGVVADPAADDEWMRLLERQEVVAKMPRAVLQNHLMLLGWHPVMATRQALQCDATRVYIIERDRGLSVGHYTHPGGLLPRPDVAWKTIPFGRLIMLAKKIVSIS